MGFFVLIGLNVPVCVPHVTPMNDVHLLLFIIIPDKLTTAHVLLSVKISPHTGSILKQQSTISLGTHSPSNDALEVDSL